MWTTQCKGQLVLPHCLSLRTPLGWKGFVTARVHVGFVESLLGLGMSTESTLFARFLGGGGANELS